MAACPACSNTCADEHRFCPTCGFPIGQVPKQPGDPLIGRTLPGGYTVFELVGVGGMGRVYRAEQQALGRTVAVKIIHGHLLNDGSSPARFITEARAASRLNHPNSVGVIDFGTTEDGLLYLVMEFLRGRDLSRVLHETGTLPLPRVVDITRQVLAALGEAHDLGIIHRDLKPENIILEPRRGGGDFVKVVDFGLAKIQAERSPTRPGIVCGTPDYMAPEQGRGELLDGRSDLYSVGVILFRMLTGRLPFEGDSPTQMVLLHLTMPPPDPRQLVPNRNLPDKLAEVCLRAMAKEPDTRFANADEFSAALKESLGSQIPVEGSSPGDLLICPSCQSPNFSRQKFCGECGIKLGVVSEAKRVEQPPPTILPTMPEQRLPLRGRVNDLAWLEDRLGEVKSALVAARLVGEEGVGKTRLLEEFEQQLHEREVRTVQVGPDPWGADVGYWTLRELLRELGQLPADGGGARHWVGASAEARRGLTEIFEQQEASELSPEDRRYLVSEALRWGLTRGAQMASGGRLAVLIDDLHRIDGASNNAICDALNEPLLCPVLLLAAHSPNFNASWSAGSARVLAPLPPATVAEIFDNTPLLPPPATPDSRGLLPLYVEHLVRFAREGGSAPPARVVDLLAQRIEHVKPDARRALQAVAILGDNASLDDIAHLIDSDFDAPQALLKLEQRGFVASRGSLFRVAHPLLREVTLAMIPVAARRELHATALQRGQSAGLPVEVLAGHAAAAQDSFQALLLLEQVSSLALRRSDNNGATLALRQALEVSRQEMFRGELEDPAQAVVLFSLKLGDLLFSQGNLTDADGVLREALDLTSPAGVDRAKVLRGLAQVARARSRERDARTYFTQALDLARRSGDADLVRALQAQLS